MIIFTVESEFAHDLHTGVNTHQKFNAVLINGHTVQPYDIQQFQKYWKSTFLKLQLTTKVSHLSDRQRVVL